MGGFSMESCWMGLETDELGFCPKGRCWMTSETKELGSCSERWCWIALERDNLGKSPKWGVVDDFVDG